MNPANWLVETAKQSPDSPALYSGTRLVADYRNFARMAGIVAARLQKDYQVGKGDRIALFANNSVEYLVAMYAVWFAGAVVVPINNKLHAREAAWIISNCEAKACFTDKVHQTEIMMHAGDCQFIVMEPGGFISSGQEPALTEPISLGEDDMIWLFYTSGTTGKPKGVMITCTNVKGMVDAYLDCVDDVDCTDTACYAAPISHGAGIYNFQHVLRGARHCVPPLGGFDPAEIFEAARTHGNLHMFAAPTMVKRLVEAAKQAGENGEGIRTIVYGGGPMYLADILEAVDVLGNRFCQIYGQGESPMCITVLDRGGVSDRTRPRWRERLQSVGVAQSGMRIAIVDDNGNALPSGEIGEITVSGPCVMKGYWNNQEATTHALRDGWLWTGDMGAVDEEGYLTLKDRSKDLIISGGSNIYPREVEEALLTHPAIREVSVVGEPDTEWGEVIVAFVCVEKGVNATEAELDAHCLEQIARFKRPKKYVFVDELPKNNYGKVLKTELRDHLKSMA